MQLRALKMPFIPDPGNLSILRHLFVQNVGIREISAQLQCTEKCVQKWRFRYDLELAGGPRMQDRRKLRQNLSKLSAVDLQRVQDHMTENPFHTISSLPRRLNLAVNEKTIRRRLKKQGNLKFRRPASKAELREGDEVRRLAYAQAHVNWVEARWKRTICIDEKVFSSSKDGKSYTAISFVYYYYFIFDTDFIIFVNYYSSRKI